jgi:hypothetical protein
VHFLNTFDLIVFLEHSEILGPVLLLYFLYLRFFILFLRIKPNQAGDLIGDNIVSQLLIENADIDDLECIVHKLYLWVFWLLGHCGQQKT